MTQVVHNGQKNKMKIFHYPLGHEAQRFLTVGELMAKLAEYPQDMPVLAEWESQRMPLGFNISKENYHCGIEAEACECLVLDAEYSEA